MKPAPSSFTLDKQTYRIGDVGGTVRLSPAEIIIVDTLLRSKGSFVSVDVLISCVWRNTDQEPLDPGKLIRVFMSRIRKKLIRIGTTTRIESGWRLGYRLYHT